MSFSNPSDRMQLINLIYTDRMMMSLGALLALPAVMVIYAWIKRQPGASKMIRVLWENGRMLLLISVVFNSCLIFVPLWPGKVSVISVYDECQFVVSIIILFILLKSEYIKDCFSDLPENKD